MNRLEDNAIAARYLALVALVVLSLQRLHEAAKGVGFQHGDVV
jgi:hypothetical protein